MPSTPLQRKPAIAVWLQGWDTDAWLRRLRDKVPDRHIVPLDAAAGTEALPGPYYLLCWKAPRAVIQRAPPPLMILSAGAGVDHILALDPAPGIPITRIVEPDLSGRMAEYVVLHCLYHLRHMDSAAVNQRRRTWDAPTFAPAREVSVGLMGVGEMGRAAATALAALGFAVRGWGRTPRLGLPFPSYAGTDELEAFLAGTDILVSLLPSTPQTHRLIGHRVFSGLRRTGPFGAPVFISAGRGDTVEEESLLAALRDGTLRAASLDVFSHEPLAASSPFWGLENAVITPHNAADSDPETIVTAVVGEIDRFESGQPLAHPVCRTRGY